METHVGNLLGKLDVASRTAAVVWLLQSGVLKVWGDAGVGDLTMKKAVQKLVPSDGGGRNRFLPDHRCSPVPKNKMRVSAFDLARGVGVMGMVAVHVLIRYGGYAANQSVYGAMVQFLGGPLAASVFLFLSCVMIWVVYRETNGRIRVAFAERAVWCLHRVAFCFPLRNDIFD